MIKQIKQITLEDLDKLSIVFTDSEIKTYGICNLDKLDIGDMLIEHGNK